ncbi:hypothetical protein HNR39_001837 [Glaciimonas immobilis]|uniref:Uncharacterized protein n=1 Tax=Glaciimonas immobilis TaxID=728004 RepID=A0A840RQH2_9BURK|nr:hypothetical protein [Glaciimonas immobilis]
MREDVALVAESKKELVIWPQSAETSTLNFIYLHSEADSPIVHALRQGINAVWKLPSNQKMPILD